MPTSVPGTAKGVIRKPSRRRLATNDFRTMRRAAAMARNPAMGAAMAERMTVSRMALAPRESASPIFARVNE